MPNTTRSPSPPPPTMLSCAPTPMSSGSWNHRPSVSSPLSSSPIRPSSPLSPLDRNSLPQRQIQSSPIQPKFKFASRPLRQNPLLRRREDVQESRRRSFLESVRQKADEKAWQRRDIEGQFLKNSLTADIGRLSYDAPVLSEKDLEDAINFQDEVHQPEDEAMLDEIPDDDDIDFIVASFETHQNSNYASQQPRSPTLSDDDYDDIFAELVAQEQEQEQEQEQSCIQSTADNMDMS